MLPNFNYSQELARRDGRVTLVNLDSSFAPNPKDPNTKGNPYKHLDTIASDLAGPSIGMVKITEVARLTIKEGSILDPAFIKAVQSN